VIHQTDRGFVISSGGSWLPGVYADRRAARYAFYFNNGELEALNSARGIGVDYRPIESADLLELRAARAARGERPHRSGRAAGDLPCDVADCVSPRVTAQLCQTHYLRMRARGTTDPAPAAHASMGERFWRHVDQTSGECWLWTGATSGGYGSLRHLRKSRRAHRISWEIHRGLIPAGLLVLHSCDVKRCVNPAHLSLGTDQQNRQEAIDRGLTPRTLDEEKVRAIRRRCGDGESMASVARAFGVAGATVRKVIRRESWAHVH
jgi:hypothetical protein